MRFTSLKSLSFGLALASFASLASAQSLVGATAKLDQPLDSKSAAIGQLVTAKLNGTVKTDSGLKLPKGTELVGKVAEVKTAENGGPVSVSLVFTSAKLPEGKEVPVKATLLAAYPESAGDGAGYGTDTFGPAPERVGGDSAFDQQAGALRNVAMNSAVKNVNSGTFVSTDGPFRLAAGTYLQVGIAPAGGASATSAAE